MKNISSKNKESYIPFLPVTSVLSKNLLSSTSPSVICILCKGLICKPLQCLQCSKCYCESCLTIYKKYNNYNSPCGCNSSMIPPSKFIKEMLSKFSFSCPYNCNDDQYDYYGIVNHIIICKKVKIPCPSCSVKVNSEKIQNIKLRRTVLQRNIKNANLYAPIDGSIDEILALNMGDYVVGGTNILRIIPNENEHLKAEIILDASKIARLKNGQIVNLRFPGLPPSRFGQLQGTISLIPADITVSSNNPVFLVEADIPEPFLFANNGEKINLRSGLSAEARIIVSRDSVMKMILRKLDFVN